MVILSRPTTALYDNMSVSLIDNTVVEEVTTSVEEVPPQVNFLIPVVMPSGATNTMELFRDGEDSLFERYHATPNSKKYGFGPDMIKLILESGTGAGVYTVNLRGKTARLANLVCLMKWKIEKDVPYTQEIDGQTVQMYYDPEASNPGATITTEEIAGGEIVRDVLHVKFENVHFDDLTNWPSLYDKMSTLASTATTDENDNVTYSEDDDGYHTIPCFAVTYRGAGEFGNNVYFRLQPIYSEYDGNMYYKTHLWNGSRIISTDEGFSFDLDAGKAYNKDYYIETIFNNQFPTMRYVTSSENQDMVNIFKQFLFTPEGYLNNPDESDIPFRLIDPFNACLASEVNSRVRNTLFAIQIDEGSIDSNLTNAFKLEGGFDGTETDDELYESLFRKEIIEDITDPLRYRIVLIPDIGYNHDTQDAILNMVEPTPSADEESQERQYFARAMLMAGDTTSFQTGIIDRNGRFSGNLPNLSLLFKYQSPMKFNALTSRTERFPASYIMLSMLLEHWRRNSSFLMPFAGYSTVSTSFIDETMPYPPNEKRTMDSFTAARINAFKKDWRTGVYMGDQMMCTEFRSDQTEFSVALLVSMILHDIAQIVHMNHMGFNEEADVQRLQKAIDTTILPYYSSVVTSLVATVSKAGNRGINRYKNRIDVHINPKDILRSTDVYLYLDEE